MFKKTISPTHPNLRFTSTLRDPLLSHISETDASKLNNLISDSIKNKPNDLSDAYQYAQKLAVFHGIPGLIQFVNISILDIKRQLDEVGFAQQLSIDTLAYLLLTKKLYKENPSDANRLMEDLMPDEKISSPDYWTKKQNEIITLGEINDLVPVATQDSEDLYNSFYASGHNSKSNYTHKK